ncbi:MAG TPA: sigma-54-dependent Fis family transcriptional regulator [Verrucomicrobia bacterium]|nr:MAG: sigma-54-dependent Fis family transcriptional regulator [Lentisphaerae bacterium GWF2_57_35]HBA85124.1 sigma-54-dependent Fis family transcriptional regulator [Verrucomicrobiota bacterium]
MSKLIKDSSDREVVALTLLLEVAQVLSRSLELRETTSIVLQKMAEHMGMMRGTITILNRETDEIVIEEAYGLSEEERYRGRYRVGEGVTGQVIQSGQAAVVPRISQEPLFLDRTRSRKKNRLGDKHDVSFFCVPIAIGNEVVGALSADRLFAEDIAFEEDVRLLSIIASLIAQAVKLRRESREQIARLEAENANLQEQLGARFKPANMIGNSHAMSKVYSLIEQVAGSDATVLILGESGVGKELVAHALHYSSPRAGRPFIRVNCAALPEGVIESELFGHEKGAFTGALAQRKGRFELAEGGTIFLDEIGDLSGATQVKLLRVLQEREFERVGGGDTLKANVRVIAATNRDLDKLIREGRFREDLYYRLHVFPIFVPPLRERKTDIILLADHFVEKYTQTRHRSVRRISTPAIDMLMAYHWPGNVRELENCIERAILLSRDGVIHGHHLPPSLQTAEASGTEPEGRLESALNALEKEILVDTLKLTRGNMAAAARRLGLTERVMGLRVAKYAIDPRRFKSMTAAIFTPD